MNTEDFTSALFDLGNACDDLKHALTPRKPNLQDRHAVAGVRWASGFRQKMTKEERNLRIVGVACSKWLRRNEGRTG